MLIGAHVSTAGGITTGLGRGVDIGAEAIQVFTQSPRQWKRASTTIEQFRAYRVAAAETPEIGATFTHATYLINLAAPNDDLYAKSRDCLVSNLVCGTAIGANGVVLHVGSHLGAGFDAVLGRIVDALERALAEAEDEIGETLVPLLLENAAGTGGTVGRSFDELARIIDATRDNERLGICLDTQHLFASGMSFASLEEADAALGELDRTVGLGRLALVHLNDSKVSLGANRDRHENLGEGEIGLDALSCLIGHPALAATSATLEVPGAGEGPRSEDVAVAKEILAAGIARRS